MRGRAYPTCLGDLADDELLTLALEPECLHERTPLEIELLRRLAQAQHIAELTHAEQRRRAMGAGGRYGRGAGIATMRAWTL